MPIDASATRAAGGEACVGAVVAAGGKIVQLEVQGVVDQLDGLARAQILESNVAAYQPQLVDAQREQVAFAFVGRLCWRNIEELT